jgi:hypothetical protein
MASGAQTENVGSHYLLGFRASMWWVPGTVLCIAFVKVA